jgi:hypothetical protein
MLALDVEFAIPVQRRSLMFRKTTITLCSALLLATTATGAFAHGGGGGRGWGGGGRGWGGHFGRFEHGYGRGYGRYGYGYGGGWCYYRPDLCGF